MHRLCFSKLSTFARASEIALEVTAGLGALFSASLFRRWLEPALLLNPRQAITHQLEDEPDHQR